MGLTIVVLDERERFLQFLDEDLCTVTETIEYGGLRTIQFEYKFQDLVEDKELFRIGNKIWIQGDVNLRDCLYVINTEVKQDIYNENSFSFECEEILVELNYAPVFSQTEINTAKDDEDKKIFRTITEHGRQEVYVDWNALNYWFGNYFNIGVVQECISTYASRISITGTVNRMTLLRNIEEETGNIFVTRYEKDIINNTIHRYLDFLNPINVNKNWTFNLEYDFHDVTNTSVCYDENGDIVNEDDPEEVARFENTAFGPEEIDEDTDTSDEDDYDVEITEPYDYESNQTYDDELEPVFAPITNLDPSKCDFRITDGTNLLNTDGRNYQVNGGTPLSWDCSDVGLSPTNYPAYAITLQKKGNKLGITINEKNYVVASVGYNPSAFIPELRDEGEIALDHDLDFTVIPDDSWLEIYDHESGVTLFHTQLNTQVGRIHEEILDFGFNLENVEYNVDETDTYTAVAPVINLSNETGDRKQLSRTDIDTIINRWLNLSITKGTVVPMIVEKINVEASSVQAAAATLGTYNRSTNYYIRPLKPNDNTDSEQKQFEFYRAIAYWQAPYTKKAGEMYVRTDKDLSVEYTDIYERPDTRDERRCVNSPKLGNTETTDEDIYAIYNQVALYLKEHEEPAVNIGVDVANLIGHEYNNYDLHDKIYVKLANTQELITAKVTKTTKEAHDIAKNTIEISNYKNINTIKTIPHETYINASNTKFKYPASKNLTAQLVNGDVDSSTEQYPMNKLLTFAVYKVENGSSTFTGKVYTKLTGPNGNATVSLKFDPGDYEIQISFAGDEVYTESSLTIKVNVSGKKEVPVEDKKDKKDKNKSKSKVNKKNKKKKKIKTYWDKYGRSPNKKEICAIGKPSHGDDTGGYTFYKQTFKNKCPHCGKASLYWGIFWAGNETSNWGKFPATGRSEGGSAEGHIFCKSCDADYSCQGNEHVSNGKKLKATSKKKSSSKSEAYKLKKGKLQFGTKVVWVKDKQVENNKNRKIRAKGISNKIKKKALAIVGNKTGKAAMEEIVKWVDNTSNLKYAGYPNFHRSAASVLNHHSANCCDGTRFFFELCDAAGLCEYYDFYYCHVYGHVYAIVETKKTKKWRYVDCASDSHGCWGYVCQGYAHGSKTSKYPKLPF